MNERKRRILQAVVEDYIMTAMPVGSRTISRKYLQEISSATIRNEMSDLEELGYMMQPHVSAGRVPSAKAYRLYVDMLMASGLNPIKEDKAAREYFLQRVSHLDDVVASTAQVLSDFTHYVSLVMMPGQADLCIATLHLVPVSRAMALLVIVTDGGIIRDTMVHVADSLDTDALYAISRMLTDRFAGKTLKEVRRKLREFAASAPAEPQVLQGIEELSDRMARENATDTITVSGTHNILNFPEYHEAEKARPVLSVLENRERLMQIIKTAATRDGTDLAVHIGPETGIPEMENCSVVLAEYTVGQGNRGTIGIIGPTRMPYARVLNTLRLVGDALSLVLTGGEQAE